MYIKTPIHCGLAAAALTLSACATTAPSKELIDARKAYDNAAQSENAHLRPDELVDAEQALQAAETAHKDDAGSREEKHLAYVAERRAQLAISGGNRAAYERQYQEKRGNLLESAKSSAVSANRQLTSANQQLTSANQQLTQQKAELAEERKLRMEAEAMARKALQDLKQIAMVKEESRGYVITLSGSVLFKTGDSELLETAKAKLEQVATALKEQDASSTIVVEGYTDSRGSDSYNQKLSLARAESVRSFLTSQDVDASRVKAKGMGESSPIASNDSAEGRANNRRVEIVISEHKASRTDAPNPPDQVPAPAS